MSCKICLHNNASNNDSPRSTSTSTAVAYATVTTVFPTAVKPNVRVICKYLFRNLGVFCVYYEFIDKKEGINILLVKLPDKV